MSSIKVFDLVFFSIKYLNEILEKGSKKADLIAQTNLKEVYEIIGLTKFS